MDPNADNADHRDGPDSSVPPTDPAAASPARRRLLAAGLLGPMVGAGWSIGTTSAAAAAGSQPVVSPPEGSAPVGSRVLRVCFPIAETGFDPAQIIDLYSRTVTAHLFEGLYAYDHLARPAHILPCTAAAMPEVSADFRTFTIRLRQGVRFVDDPAFGGKPRELVAEDYVYSLKRYADPATKSPNWGTVEQIGIVGLDELRKRASAGAKFDYDSQIDGLRALGRYTLRIRVSAPRPRLLEILATGDLFGALAREVVEHYGPDIMAHPVGTGPFRLGEWRRNSLIVLERNPAYRDVRYDAHPAPDDAEGHALLSRLKGRRLPLVDRVEVSIIEEQQPRWLAFLNRQLDIVSVSPEFANTAMPNGRIAPNLAREGVQGWRVLQPDVAMTLFNMEDPVVGGNAPEKVALRRAIGLSVDVDREIRIARRGLAIPAQSPFAPHTTGYDPTFKSENGDHDVARAKALLDLYGYVDRDGDGWREGPDGKPLVLELATQPDQVSRQFDELWKKHLDSIGLRLKFNVGKWPEQLKAARAGKLMMWHVGLTAAAPDGLGALQRYHSPQAGGQNLARFSLPRMDEIYERVQALPDGPERQALFDEARRIAIAYMPYKTHVHRIVVDVAHAWVSGYRRPVFWQDQWQFIDVDAGLRAERLG